MLIPGVSTSESRTWRVSLTGDAPDGTTVTDAEELRMLLGPKCQLITVKAPETITLKVPIRQEPKKAKVSGLINRGYGSHRSTFGWTSTRSTFGWTWSAVMYSSGQRVEEAMESASDDFLDALVRTERSEWTILRIEGETIRRSWRTSGHVQVRITPGRPFRI